MSWIERSDAAVAGQADRAAVDKRAQTRARKPDAEGFVVRGQVRLFYEMYGTGEDAMLFLPTWEIVHSRVWKFQIPYFARHGRVVTFDRRGNGRSDRPRGTYLRSALTLTHAEIVLTAKGWPVGSLANRLVQPAVIFMHGRKGASTARRAR